LAGHVARAGSFPRCIVTALHIEVRPFSFHWRIVMNRFLQLVGKLRRSEEGATMIEYGLLAALVSIASLAALQLLGPALLNIFNQVVTAITGA
jgi:pilus assembly protein Flp/PilA